MEKVITSQPFNAPAHSKLSDAYRGLGKDELAAKHQQLASEISGKQIRMTSLLKQRDEDPYDPMIYRELEQLHRELGDLEMARLWHRWTVRVSPHNSLVPSAQIP